MSKLGDRIRMAREAKGIDQKTLADRTGYSQPAISDIESGKTPMPRGWRKLADELDIPHDEFRVLMVESGRVAGKTTRLPAAVRSLLKAADDKGLLNEAGEYRSDIDDIVPAPIAPPPDNTMIPIIGRAAGGDDGKFYVNGEVLEWAPRHPRLVNVSLAYGVYVDGESMYPRYRPGDKVWVHPTKPPQKGDDVVVQIHPDIDGELPYGFIKEFQGFTPTKLILSQFNPAKRIEFDREKVISVHPVVASER